GSRAGGHIRAPEAPRLRADGPSPVLARMIHRAGRRGKAAVVLGRIDLVRALGRAGIASIVVAARADPIGYSRHVIGTIDPGAGAVDALLAHAGGSVEPPPRCYESDAALMPGSRNRDRPGRA